ncbi:MAG: phosphoribosylglycinamide formyltransferase [Paludibacteraceae bacterium]|nr:phosphoribosylglycinamide formyltransferase [Paludibacteraceae bacterium]
MSINIAIWASGNGSNAENIMNYFKDKKDLVNISIVMCNNKDAFVLKRAEKFNTPTFVFTYKELNNSDVVDKKLDELNIDFIVLSGFMLKVPDRIISRYANKIVNIHPALLPKFGGKGMYGDHVHEAVIAAGEKESGITVHYANEHYDEGSTIFQAKCPVLPDDTPDTLAQRVHSLEYAHYPEVIEQVLRELAKK